MCIVLGTDGFVDGAVAVAVADDDRWIQRGRIRPIRPLRIENMGRPTGEPPSWDQISERWRARFSKGHVEEKRTGRGGGDEVEDSKRRRTPCLRTGTLKS